MSRLDDLATTKELEAKEPVWSPGGGFSARLQGLINPCPELGPPRPEIAPQLPHQLSEASARLMLLEAEGLYAARRDQVIRAEARASTLQASAGVAVGLALTGAAFLVDPTKVANREWHIALSVVLVALLTRLGMAGYLANRATAKILTWYGPRVSDIVDRADMPIAEACWRRAVALLKCYEWDRYFSNFKILHVKVAGLWFRAALGCFALLSVLLAAYTIFGAVPHTAH